MRLSAGSLPHPNNLPDAVRDSIHARVDMTSLCVAT